MSSPPLAPFAFTYRTIPSPSSTLTSSTSTSTSTAVPPLHLHLDVHLPPPSSSSHLTTTSNPIPLIFAVHPGGLTAYSNKHLPPWLFDLAREKGWCVVAPNYRLLVGGGEEGGLDAGDVLEDVLKAYEWAVGGSLDKELEGMGELAGVRFDREKIAVVGMSAGGLLSLLLPTQLPSSLPKPKSLVALYPVARPFSPFYTTPRTSSTSAPTSNSILPSLNLPPTFLTIADSLFTHLSSLPTTSSSPSLSPAEMSHLEQPGSDGHRGMIYDWSIERGVFGDLCLGKGVLGSKGKNNDDDASSPSTLNALQERLSPLVGSNSPTKDLFPRTFLIHGDEDQLVLLEESRFVKERLEKVGVEVELRVVEGVDHGFDGEMCLEGGKHEEIWREVGKWIEGSWGR